MKINNIIVTTLFAGLVFLVSIPIQARVLFDSTSNSIFSLDPVSTEFKVSASFITHEQPIHLTILTVRWRKDIEQTGDIHILLLGDKNGYPGSVLDSLASVETRALALGDQWLTIPIQNTTALKAQTRYWIAITATDAAGFVAYSREKVGKGIATESYLNNFGLHRNADTGPYIFKLEGIEH